MKAYSELYEGLCYPGDLERSEGKRPFEEADGHLHTENLAEERAPKIENPAEETGEQSAIVGEKDAPPGKLAPPDGAGHPGEHHPPHPKGAEHHGEHRPPHEPEHLGKHHPPHHNEPGHHPPKPGDEHERDRVRPKPEEILKYAQNAQPLELLDMCHREFHRPEARGQMRAVRVLAQRGEMSQRELQDILHIQPASLTELLNKLEDKGYISRARSEDRRANTLMITEEGRKIAAENGAYPEEELLSALNTKQREELAFLLRTLLEDWLSRFYLDDTPQEHK